MVEYSDSQQEVTSVRVAKIPREVCPKFAVFGPAAANRVPPGGDACDVALLSRKNCSVALFMTFKAFAEIIMLSSSASEGGSWQSSSLSVMYLFNGFRAKLSSTPNYPQSILPERQAGGRAG